MKGCSLNIKHETLDNRDFRRVLYTGRHVQLVLMSLEAGEEIGEEVHTDRDQFFRFEEGQGVVLIDGVANTISCDFAVIVPAGARHNVKNTGSGRLNFYTIYGPPEHLDQLIETTRAEALETHEEWDGVPTECSGGDAR